MRGKGLTLLVLGISLLCASTAVTMASSFREIGDSRTRQQDFQRLVGGLGTGPTVDLSGCPFSFDARLADSCRYDRGPIPGGEFFCREHGCSVFSCSSHHDHDYEH
jgi:hypothetical protein